MAADKSNTKYSIMFILLFIISIFVISATLIFTLLLINYRTNDIIASADSSLLTAVEFNRMLLGQDYHDKIQNDKSISKESFDRIVKNFAFISF